MKNVSVVGLSKSAKRTRKVVSIIAVLALLAALLPVVPAWAAANLSVTPSPSNAGAEVDYAFSVTLSDTDVIPVSQVAGKNVVVTFPSGFEIKTAGVALPVTVTVDSTPYYAQVIPTVSADKLSAAFVVPAALLPSSGNVGGFEVKGLRVKNAAVAGAQTVRLTFEGANKTVQANVTLVAGVYSVTIDQPAANAQVPAGSNVLFKGYVKDAAGNGVGGASVAVKQGSTSIGTGTTLSNGYYEVSITAPTTTSGNVTYTVEASKSVDGVSTSAQTSVTVSVVAGQPAKLDFSTPPSSLTKGQRAKFTVQLKDSYNNVATAGAGGVTVYLNAELTDASGKSLGGRFYDAESGGKEITSVTIAQGSSSADFWFEPVVSFVSTDGKTLTVSASAQGLTATTKSYSSVSTPTAPSGVTVNITPLATDASGAPVAGWPLKVVATLDQAADQDYTVQVNLKSDANPVDWATWDTAANLSFGAAGSKRSGDTIVIAKGKKELVFYVYTTVAAEGKTLAVEVKETSAAPVFSGSNTTSNFSKDLARSLSAGWNVLSTPLKLAGAGTMASLVGDADRIEIVYTFENGSFRQVDKNNEKLEPLKGYFVKMKQGATVSYYLTRATMVEDTVPTKRQLAAGWNLLGVGTLSNLNVEDILANVKDKYTAVVNPGAGNLATWSAVTPASARVEVKPGDAYWVYMAAPGEVTTLAVPQLISP
ncbi:carboxypeptidase-like regulatory domain-containing protein [Desulfovirgula thermocuniculi]|uniref:carboxypeptidase-like regulatory domain-containing protein n=1 Tax=Desulfovirgula thermocuniculi TaxID=348842 RepID=UPI0004047000|nr:carboxypeptidase-like regulatory domain-containing protein [Desulfovirgula thermocuniculi]